MLCRKPSAGETVGAAFESMVVAPASALVNSVGQGLHTIMGGEVEQQGQHGGRHGDLVHGPRHGGA